ncbi:hypothetical protein [Nocardiopsis sp. FR26]|uniref:hypothetical protein n=1 Tax=Nocardiopsis sp. FR26 TaxID=2605987 RepID=UPI0013588C88|nr:hypothetical protein [Nocardiopsis sp. FR26]
MAPSNQVLPHRPTALPRTCISYLDARYGIVREQTGPLSAPDRAVQVMQTALREHGVPPAVHPNPYYADLAVLVRRYEHQRTRR